MRAPLGWRGRPAESKGRPRHSRSAATASRRVAVKSSAWGSPQISPTTAESPEHLRPLFHCPQRVARVACLDMNNVEPAKAGRMDPPAFEDRHAMLDPQQRLGGGVAPQVGPRGSPPSRRRAGALRTARTGSSKGWASASAHPTRWGAHAGRPRGRSTPHAGFPPHGAARRQLAGDERQLSPHDPQGSCSSFVLHPAAVRRESQVSDSATDERSISLRNALNLFATRRVALREMPNAMWLQPISTVLSRSPLEVTGGAERRSRPCATRWPASAPAAFLGSGGSAGRPPCGRRPARRCARHCSGEGRPRKGEARVTTARTISGTSRASSRA